MIYNKNLDPYKKKVFPLDKAEFANKNSFQKLKYIK
jgi:hypothetical protein